MWCYETDKLWVEFGLERFHVFLQKTAVLIHCDDSKKTRYLLLSRGFLLVYQHWVDQHWLTGDMFFQTWADATAKSSNADWNGSYQFADQKKEMKVNSYFQPTYHAR